jgi:hypothetical protein
MILLNFPNRFKYVSKLEITFEFIFFALFSSLKVQLEEIRNSENQLRWQPEEDHPDCQRCHSQFSVTWRKHHCRKFYHQSYFSFYLFLI